MNDQLESALSALVLQSRYVRNHVVVHTHRQLQTVRTDLDALRQDALTWQSECQQGFAELESVIVAACENSEDLKAPEALVEERDRSAQAEMEVAELRARLRDVEAERDTLEMRLNDARSGFEVRAAQLKEAHREREATLEQQLRLLSASSARVEAMLLGRSATMDPFVPSAAAEISSPPRRAAAMQPVDDRDLVPADIDTSSASAQWALKELRERRSEARRLATERARVPVAHWTETGHVASPATEVVKKPKKKKIGTTTKKKAAPIAAATNAPPTSHWR
jgi:chromosome segregation ATPase